MKVKKLLALVMCAAMLLSLAACGGNTTTNTTNGTDAPPETTTAPVTPDETTVPTTQPNDNVAKDPASVDFEDGSISFIQLYSGKANADASILEVVDYNGSKALKVSNGSGKVPYVAFDISSLLGENAGNVATIEMTIGLEHPDGTFYAASGNIVTWTGADLVERTHAWSVYLENKNPKSCVAALDTDEGEVFTADKNIMMVTLVDDNGLDDGAANANFYIDDIRFLDADGNLIAADTAAAFNGPDAFNAEKDMSNLKYLGANTVSLDGMAGISGDGWGQNGVEMTEEFIAALVPGAVIEIEFSSDADDMWIVMPWADAGWIRVQQQTAATNNSKNICQITYEQIAAACGSEDVATWGAMFQCESSGAWEVYSVKVGQDSGLVNATGKTLIDGFTCSAGGWAQNGFELTAEQWAMFQPGTMLEVQYSSANGDLWALLPWSAAGWMRINADNGVTPICNGSILQVTYEQMAAVCGEDVSTWGTMLQFEASGDWEVYSVSICTGSLANTTGSVAVEGFACSAGGWAQNGFELTAEQWAMIQPGTVITVQYNSANGDLWAVLPWSAAGWMRINADNGITPIYDGSVLQVTYEQMAAVCGEDVSTWGTMLQFEASGDWEVYAVYICTAAE